MIRWYSVVPTTVMLLVVWLLFYGDITVGNVIGGVVVIAAVLYLFPLDPRPRQHRVHVWGTIRFALFMIYSLVVSSIAVLKTAIHPTPERMRSGILRVTLEPTSPLVTTLVANAITVTPGTLTVAASDDGVLHVHILGLGSTEDFIASVAELHQYVLAAFEPIPQEAVS